MVTDMETIIMSDKSLMWASPRILCTVVITHLKKNIAKLDGVPGRTMRTIKGMEKLLGRESENIWIRYDNR